MLSWLNLMLIGSHKDRAWLSHSKKWRYYTHIHLFSSFLRWPFFVRISGNRFENVSRKTGTSKGKAKKGENENQETIPETHGVEGGGSRA